MKKYICYGKLATHAGVSYTKRKGAMKVHEHDTKNEGERYGADRFVSQQEFANLTGIHITNEDGTLIKPKSKRRFAPILERENRIMLDYALIESRKGAGRSLHKIGSVFSVIKGFTAEQIAAITRKQQFAFNPERTAKERKRKGKKYIVFNHPQTLSVPIGNLMSA